MNRQFKRAVGVALILGITAAGGAGAGTALSAMLASPISDAPDDAQLKPKYGTLYVEGNVADAAGEAPWAVRRYTGQTGLDCFEPGQVKDGIFGSVHNGRFFPAAEDEPNGSCADLQSSENAPDGVVVSILRRYDGDSVAQRSVIYGLARPAVTMIEATVGAKTRTIRVGPQGTFLFVYAGEVTFENASIRYRYGTGRSTELRNAASLP